MINVVKLVRYIILNFYLHDDSLFGIGKSLGPRYGIIVSIGKPFA